MFFSGNGTLYTYLSKSGNFFKEHGLADKIKPYAESPSSLEYMDAQKIFRHLSMLTESYDDWKIMLQLYDKASLEISNANLYSFVKSTQRNSNRLKEICNLFLINKPVLQTSIKEQHYELMIAYLIMNSPDFETSIYFMILTMNVAIRIIFVCWRSVLKIAKE